MELKNLRGQIPTVSFYTLREALSALPSPIAQIRPLWRATQRRLGLNDAEITTASSARADKLFALLPHERKR